MSESIISAGGNSPADVIFICDKCGFCCGHKEAKVGCSSCKNTMFIVARKDIPLMVNPQKDPYRQHDNQEDGYKLTTPGSEGDASGSGFGSNSRADRDGVDELSNLRGEEKNNGGQNMLPTDWDTFGDRGTLDPDNRVNHSEPVSPALTDDNSPLNPINYKEPRHIGPFNMPHEKPSAYNRWKSQSVYDRISNRGRK